MDKSREDETMSKKIAYAPQMSAWVEMPDHYDSAKVTRDDCRHDSQLRELSAEGWIPTHVIRMRGRTYHVMLVDGAAFTHGEWDAMDRADFEMTAEGWLFQGQPFDGTVEEARS